MIYSYEKRPAAGAEVKIKPLNASTSNIMHYHTEPSLFGKTGIVIADDKYEATYTCQGKKVPTLFKHLVPIRVGIITHLIPSHYLTTMPVTIRAKRTVKSFSDKIKARIAELKSQKLI